MTIAGSSLLGNAVFFGGLLVFALWAFGAMDNNTKWKRTSRGARLATPWKWAGNLIFMVALLIAVLTLYSTGRIGG